MITVDSCQTERRERRLLLMSIRPCYWERIAEGSKRFELRRTPVRCQEGDLVLVYASAPCKALVGAFEVEGVIRRTKQEVWRKLGPDLGIDRESYFRYFDGTELATAIKVRRVVSLAEIALSRLRSIWPEFRPPQSFMYWQADHLRHLELEPALRFD